MQAASKTELRKFGLTVGLAFAVFGTVSWARGHETPPLVLWTLAGLLVVPALVVPAALGPIRRGWMRVGMFLGEVNSRVILTVFYYTVIAPVGFVLRRVRDPLNRSLRDGSRTDWVRRERVPVDPARYERQF
jgi:hypothetical protein